MPLVKSKRKQTEKRSLEEHQSSTNGSLTPHDILQQLSDATIASMQQSPLSPHRPIDASTVSVALDAALATLPLGDMAQAAKALLPKYVQYVVEKLSARDGTPSQSSVNVASTLKILTDEGALNPPWLPLISNSDGLAAACLSEYIDHDKVQIGLEILRQYPHNFSKQCLQLINSVPPDTLPSSVHLYLHTQPSVLSLIVSIKYMNHNLPSLLCPPFAAHCLTLNEYLCYINQRWMTCRSSSTPASAYFLYVSVTEFLSQYINWGLSLTMSSSDDKKVRNTVALFPCLCLFTCKGLETPGAVIATVTASALETLATFKHVSADAVHASLLYILPLLEYTCTMFLEKYIFDSIYYLSLVRIYRMIGMESCKFYRQFRATNSSRRVHALFLQVCQKIQTPSSLTEAQLSIGKDPIAAELHDFMEWSITDIYSLLHVVLDMNMLIYADAENMDADSHDNVDVTTDDVEDENDMRVNNQIEGLQKQLGDMIGSSTRDVYDPEAEDLPIVVSSKKRSRQLSNEECERDASDCNVEESDKNKISSKLKQKKTLSKKK